MLIYASALPGKISKHKNHSFSLKCYITALTDFNQLLLAFLNLVHLELTLTLLYDSLNLTVNGVQLWAAGGHSSGESKL